jgi:heme-degrading monooxygenase HmoA
MTPHARVLLHATARDGKVEEFEHAFLAVTERMQRAKGHIQDELIREVDQPGQYIVLSEWVSTEAFLTWFHDPRHHDTTAPMNPFWHNARVQIFELVARLDRYEPRDPPGPEEGAA